MQREQLDNIQHKEVRRHKIKLSIVRLFKMADMHCQWDMLETLHSGYTYMDIPEACKILHDSLEFA
jgi:hypothetical protein